MSRDRNRGGRNAARVLSGRADRCRILVHVFDELRRAEHDVAAAEDGSVAVALDYLPFPSEVRAVVLLVFVAFHVDVGAQLGQEIGGSRVGVDVTQIDDPEGGEVFGPHFFRDVGSLRALADLGIAGQ